MNMRSMPGIVLATLLVLILLGTSVFVVKETDRALVVRLGKLVTVDKEGTAKLLTPGLHMKIPFIDRILFFDVRLNMSEVPSARIVTKEKKDLIVDLFAKWRINDFALFYKRTFGTGESKEGRERAEEL